MEEKIFIPQADLSFDIQRFADVTYELNRNEEMNIDGITYKATDKDSVVEVTADTVTLKSGVFPGNISVGSEGESLNGKNFVVDSGVEATFKLQNADSVTINGIVYKAKDNVGSVMIVDGKISLNGNFEITIAAGTSFTFGDATFTADHSAVTLIYNGDGITFNGVTYSGIGNVTFTDSLVTVDGSFTVGNGTQSLSGKKFAFNSGSNVTVTLARGDSNVTVNGVIYAAGTETLDLDISGDTVNIDGNGATVNGTGNFVIYNSNSAVNINGIDVTSTNAKAAISFNEDNTVQNLSSISVDRENLNLAADATISNSTLNLGTEVSLTLGGVTYSGNGAVTVNDTTDDVTLSGTSMSVYTSNADLSGKNISFTGECKVKINGDTYSASSSGTGSVSFNSTGAATVSNSSVTFDENTTKTLTINSGNNLEVGGVTYTATDSSAQVEVTGNAVTISSGTVVVSAGETYTVDLTSGATAQIAGVNFTKSSDSENGTADIHVDGNSITLNAGFTVGDGTTPLNGLTVTLTTSDESTFNLGGGNVTVIQNSGSGNDVAGDTIEGVNFEGNGTASVSNSTVTLTATSGSNITVSGSNTNEYNFTLNSGTYNFGDTSVNVTSGTASVSGVNNGSLTVSGTANVSTASGKTITVNGTTYSATGAITLSVADDSVSSISNSGGSTVTVTIGSVSNNTYTLQNGKTLTYDSSNGGTWTGGVEYTSYTYDNGTMYGVYEGGSDTLATYADIFDNNTVHKPLTYKGSGSVIAGGTTYTVSNGTAEFTSSGIGSVTSGTVTYDSTASTFTFSGNTYTNTSVGNNVTYEKTSTGTTVYAASGTRAYDTSENATKVYSGDGYTYNVTAGTYSIEITDGNGTPTLAGTAQKIFTSGESFTYNSNNYTPVDGSVTYNISFNGDTITPGTKAGSGTRNDGSGTYNITGDNSGEYTLSSGAVMKLTLSAGTEEFYSGSATSGSLTSFKIGTNTYTGNATLTLTRSNGNDDTYSLASGSGTRSASATSFTYPPGTGGKTYTPSGDVTYILNTSGESLYAATGTSTEVSGDTYDVGNNTYDLTSGTYSLTFTSGNTSIDPILTSGAGTATKNTAFTISGDSKEYTPLNGNVTLNLNYDGTNKTESFSGDVTYVDSTANQKFTGDNSKEYTATSGITYKKQGSSDTNPTVYNATGTRAYDSTAGDSVTFPYQGNTYKVTAGTYTGSVSSGTKAEPTLTSTTAVFTANTGDSFKVNDSKTYTATVATTFTLNNGNSTPTMSGKGTRSATEENSFTYGGKTYSSSNIVKITENGAAEELYSATGTRSKDTNEKYTYNSHTYTLTSGTFNIDVTDNNTPATEYLTSGAGTMTPTGAFTIKSDPTSYTPLNNGNVTLSLSVTGKNDTDKTESFTGDVTYTGTEGTFTTTDNKTYTKTSSNITYKKNGNTDNNPTVYTATGTRAFDSEAGDSETDRYNGDQYNVVSGTYTVNVTTGNPTETLTNSAATYSIGAGTRFHFGTNSTEYTATANTLLTLGYSNGTPNGLTNASGAGTRTATDADSNITVSYEEDTYKTNASATIKGTISGSTTINDTFLYGTATYTTSNETFHANGKAYNAIAATTITYNKTSAGVESKTFSSGSAGTRTAAGTEKDTYTGALNSGEYTIANGAKIKWTATANTNTGTETFYSGSATRKTDSYNNGTYTYTSAGATDLTLTWSKTNGTGDVISFTGGTGTRADSNPFIYSGNTYTLSSGQATYTLAANAANERLYAATGTRHSNGNDEITGNWGNTYKIPNGTGTVSITVSGYNATDNTPKVTDGEATNTYAANATFTYGTDKVQYSANHAVTLSLNATSGSGTETFESGSAQKNGTDEYIVKGGSKVTIGTVEYTATGADIITVNNLSAAEGTIDGTNLTGNFSSNEATIGGIKYTSTGANSIEITDVNTVNITGGTFTAEGNFTTERTITNNTFQVTGDADNSVKATFNSDGKITKIVNLGGTATITGTATENAMTIETNAPGTFTIGGTAYKIDQGTATFTLNDSGKVTKIEATESNGSFKFGEQSFTIENDNVQGVTFTIDPTEGTATKIEGLQRTDATYAHVTVTDGGDPIDLYIRRDSDDPVKTNGTWIDKDIINFYVVTYENNKFTVQAVDLENHSTLVNITSDDYTITDGKTLTFKDTTKNIIVENKTDDAIKVGNLAGDIKNTNGKALRIEPTGDFKLGTFSGITFTESLSGDFDVSSDAEFTVDETGKINVSAKTDESSGEIVGGIVEVEAPKNADLHITSKGTFKFNGTSIIQIDNNNAEDIKILFDGSGNVNGISTDGDCKITVMPTSSSSFDLADLAESADTVYGRSFFEVENTTNKTITYVVVNNDDNGIITYDVSNGNLSALGDIATEASVLLSGSYVPDSITINKPENVVSVTANTAIKLNSTTNAWTCGDTQTAQDTTSNKYKVEIGADNKILLYVGTKQTKNVADYKEVFGNDGPQPAKDDGVLPTYPAAGITFANDAISKIESLKITPPTSASSYKINGYEFIISAETNFHPTTDDELEVTLKSGGNVIYDGATYTSSSGSMKAIFKDKDKDNITLESGAKVTNVSNKTYKVKSNAIFDNVTVTGLDNSDGTEISGVTTNSNETKLTIGSNDEIKVTGDKTYTVDATNDKEKISGISNGAQVKAEGYEIETDSNGTFKFGDTTTQDFVVAGDDKVTFKYESSGITKISDLSATGSITGNFSDDRIKVNADANIVNVTGDDDIGIIGGNGTVSKIYNVSGGANVVNAGGASTISTDEAGTYTFGAKTYNISAGTADFLSSGVIPAISGIKNVSGSATVSVYQAETSDFAVNGNNITFKGNDYSTPLKLAMGGDTISTVEGLAANGEIEGLSAGTIVEVADNADAIKINTADFQADKAATVYAAAGGYSSITGVATGTTFTKVKNGAIIIPSVEGEGTYIFVDNTYTFSAKPTLVAGASNALASIGGLMSGDEITLSKNESGLKIGKDTLKLTRDGGTDGIKLTMGNDTIATVKSLANGDAIEGLKAGAIVEGTDGNEITVNQKAIKISDSNYTVHASANGYASVTGIDEEATFDNIGDNTALLIPNTASSATYTFGNKTYTFSAAPTLKAYGAALTDIIGLTADQSVKIYQAETGLKVGKDTIVLNGENLDNGVTLIMNASGNVATVKGLQDEISGLTSGAIVEAKADADVKINTAELKVNQDVMAHVKDSTGYDYVTIKPGAEVTTGKSVSFVTDGTGTYTFPDSADGEAHVFEIAGATEVTIKTGDDNAVTDINGVSDALITFKQSETALSINGKAVKVSENDVLKIDANGAVEGIDGTAEGGTYDLPSNVTLKVNPTAETTINEKKLQITGNNEVTVHTANGTGNGYDWVAGIKTGANVTAVESGVSLVTDGAGTFVVGGNTYTTDDAQITLKTGADNKVTEIAGLDADKYLELSQAETGLLVNGKSITFTEADSSNKLKLNIGNNATIKSVENLQGNISGLSAGTLVKVVAEKPVKINTADLEVDQEVTAHVKDDNGYDYVTITSGSAVKTVANNVSLVTDGAGIFVVDGHTYTTDDAQITLKTGADNKVTEIAGLDADKYLELSQAETGLKVNGKSITFTGDYSGTNLKLNIGNNATIKSVENLQGDISGLSAGVEIKVTSSEVKINSKSVQITDSDSEYSVKSTASGYGTVTGFKTGAEITAVESGVILIPDSAGASSYTFDGKIYEFSAKPTLVAGASNALASIGGLTSGQYVELQAAEASGLYIGANNVILEGTNLSDEAKVKFIMGDNNTVKTVENLKDSVRGLSAGALVQVTNNSDAVGINGKALNTTDDNITVHATAGGYDYLTGLSDGANVSAVESGVSLVTDGAGTFVVKDHTYTTDDAQITLKTGDGGAVTEIAGLDADKHIEFSQAETSLKVNGKSITFTGDYSSNKLKFNIGNNATISSVENLQGDISGLSAGAFVQVNKNDDAVHINGVELATNDGDITVHATASGYDTITGLSAGAAVTKAKQNATLVTDGEGAFTFDSKVFTTADDNNVAFVMGDENKLAGVYELDGKISGNFTGGLKVDGKDILIGTDDAADVYADGSKVTKIEGLNNGANVQKSGGASTISTDEAGTFTFGAKTYNISAGTADFLSSGDVPVISGIKNIDDDAEVTVYQNELLLTVENNTLKLTNGVNALKLTMNGDTISAVEDLGANGEVSGLTAGANVNVATNEKVTVNGVALQINEGDDATAYTAQAAANGYNLITGVSGDGLNVSKAVNASIEVATNDDDTTEEKFTFGTKSYTVNEDDDQKVIFVTDGNTNVTAVGGLNGKLKSNATTNKINGANVYSSSADVWISANDNGITSLTDVTDNDTVSVPSGVEVFVTGSGNDVADFTINGIAYHLIGESDTISVTDKKIKGLDANARLTIGSGAEGNYVVNGKELYITPGRNVVIGEATGAHLYDPEAVDFSEITPEDEIIERVFGENVAATIVPVTDASTSGQSPGAVIVTEDNQTANLNNDNQLAVVKAEGGTVNITNTNDSVVASADVTVNLQSGNSNARLMQTAGTMTVDGYDYSTGAGIQISNADIVAAVQSTAVQFGSEISLGENGPKIKIQSYATDKENIVNLYDITGKKKQTVYYANDTKSALTGDNSANVFVGSWNGTVSDVVIAGGSGNDTAFGGAGDTFNLGNGDNYLELSGSTGATVELTATSGNTTVEGFDTGNDIVKLNAANAQVYYTADGLIFTNANGQASLSIQDVSDPTKEDGANGIAYVNVKIDDSRDDAGAVNTAVAREGMAVEVTGTTTTAYVGQNSGIVLNEVDGNIDLDNGTGKFGGTDVTFRGITSVKGGSLEVDIIGASTVNNTLEAGKGGGSIWGKGAASDLLIANNSDEKKPTTFIFASGDGNDTISNLDNTDDVVSISGSAFSSITTSNNDVVIKYQNAGDSLTIKNAVGKKFKADVDGSQYLVNVGKDEVAFDGSQGLYYATEENAVLKVAETYDGEIIDLNGDGVYTIGANINQIDASDVNESITIIGNEFSANTITAGNGGSSIYSGNRAYDDVIIAGAGADTFRCTSSTGNDTITGVGDGDKIELVGKRIMLNRCKSITYTYDSANKKLVIGLSDNSSLTIMGDIENLTFSFSNRDLDWEAFQTATTNKPSQSGDLAEDYWEDNVYADELLDGENNFFNVENTENIFDHDVKNIAHANGELWTGNVQYSIAGGEQAYNFGELVHKNNG